VAPLIFHRQRGEERTRIAVRARLQIGTYDCEATLLNAASRGVLAAVDNPPVRGTRVRLVIGDMQLAGTVRWRGSDCCGIALAEPIGIADLIEGHGVPAVVVPEPRGLRSLGVRFRALVGERR
jgi:hypothetical protein